MQQAARIWAAEVDEQRSGAHAGGARAHAGDAGAYDGFVAVGAGVTAPVGVDSLAREAALLAELQQMQLLRGA
jgi:hypothetical protein